MPLASTISKSSCNMPWNMYWKTPQTVCLGLLAFCKAKLVSHLEKIVSSVLWSSFLLGNHRNQLSLWFSPFSHLSDQLGLHVGLLRRLLSVWIQVFSKRLNTSKQSESRDWRDIELSSIMIFSEWYSTCQCFRSVTNMPPWNSGEMHLFGAVFNKTNARITAEVAAEVALALLNFSLLPLTAARRPNLSFLCKPRDCTTGTHNLEQNIQKLGCGKS